MTDSQQPTRSHLSRLSYGIVAFVMILLVFGAGYLAGKQQVLKSQVINENGVVDIVKVLDLYKKNRSDSVSFDQFWSVWDIVKKNYVDQPVDEVKLFYGALEGMVSGLADPYSIYLSPDQASEFTQSLSGEFEGIGAEVGFDDGQLIIIAPLPSSPAEKAGIRPGDRIFMINSSSTLAMSLDEAVAKIRGPGGTTVTLTLSHKNEDVVEDITITRQVINIPTVVLEKEDNNLVYIRISQFNQDTWKDFDKAVNEVVALSPKGLILDLRSNPGGFLDSSIAVASEWVEKGVIVRERGNGHEEVVHDTVGRHRLAHIPTIVLVDEGTASGSEIVAGALQDHKKATVVGQQTFGKGSVQDFQLLPDGSALKLTIARWFTPNNAQIDKHGIRPDIMVEEMFTALTSSTIPSSIDSTNKSFIDHGREKARDLLLP